MSEEQPTFKDKVKSEAESRKKKGLPLNLPLLLEDGRTLEVKRGSAETMVVRQKKNRDGNNAPLKLNEIVACEAAPGTKAVMRVEKKVGKDWQLRIVAREEVK